MVSSSYQKWVEAGYEIFATEGPEGLNVERLSRQLGLNKSGFYHYFGDMEFFISRIIELHYVVGQQFADEVKECKNFDPEYLKVLFKFKKGFMMQIQLRKRMDNPLYKKAFEKVERQNEKARIQLWAPYLGINNNPQLAKKLWEMMRDMIFIRFSSSNKDIDFIKSITVDVKNVVKDLRISGENPGQEANH